MMFLFFVFMVNFITKMNKTAYNTSFCIFLCLTENCVKESFQKHAKCCIIWVSDRSFK